MTVDKRLVFPNLGLGSWDASLLWVIEPATVLSQGKGGGKPVKL